MTRGAASRCGVPYLGGMRQAVSTQGTPLHPHCRLPTCASSDGAVLGGEEVAWP